MATACVWLFTDPRSFKDRLRRLAKPAGMIAAFFEIIIVAVQLTQPTFFPFPLALQGMGVALIGIFTSFVGALFASWARLSMGESWGSPAQHDIKIQKDLITRGPFKYSRNPIYVGLMVMFIGFELALRSWLILLAIPLYYFINRAIQTEEKLLDQHFGKEYSEYTKKVGRFL